MAEKKHTLTMIAGELNMSAKTLRAILRKNDYKRPGTRWVFTTEEKAEVKALTKTKTVSKKAAKKITAPLRKSRGSTGVHAVSAH